MTNRQKAEFYNDLYERADELHFAACNKEHAILNEKFWEVSQIISAICEHTSKMERSEMWKTETTVLFDDEVQVMRDLTAAHKMKGKALSLLCSFAKKMKAAREAETSDEANN